MTGSAKGENGMPGRLAALLTDAAADAAGAADNRAGGVYLRSSTPGQLRLAVLAGLPGSLFRPWWRLHVDRPFPVADVHRLGVHVVLPNATETMRRYPQFAAGLPFPFGSIHVPVAHAASAFGVLTVLRASAADAAEMLTERDRLTRVAQRLGGALRRLEQTGAPVRWDDEPLSVRPPATCSATARSARFSWEPATGALIADEHLPALLGVPAGRELRHVRDLAECVADPPRLQYLLRQTAAGRPPSLPVPVRTANGKPRLVRLWGPEDTDGARSAGGVVLDAGSTSTAEAAADLLPDGVLCLDRLGVVGYANPRAAELLRRPRAELVGRSLWEGVPWLRQPAYEEHLRAVLLSDQPAHFHVRRPSGQEEQPAESDWLALSVYAGTDILTCTVRPSSRVPEPPMEPPVDPWESVGGVEPGRGARPASAEDATAEGTATAQDSTTDQDAVPGEAAVTVEAAVTAPMYRPIALAIALTEAVTARQVSAVVMQELLPAFGGRMLAIYLLQDRRLYLAWEHGFPEGFLAPFDGVGLEARLPGVETLTTGRPLFFDSMHQLQSAYPGIPLDATEGARAFLPLIASGRPVGSCILGFDRPRSFSTQERTVLTAVAGLIAHAMEKAQRYETEAALARGLQQALLPHRLSAHPQVETAGRYLPGTQGMEVGGDWYDVVETGGALALVIGDVQGHGVQAAATMGQLRSAVRAFAVGDHPPDEVMRGTNRLLIDLDPGQFASCCYVRLDPLTGVARAARAGHPPPLLRRPDGGTEVVEIPGGVVLGVDPGAGYPVTELCLEPGAILALYTDGLVERPGADIDDGIAALRVALSRVGGGEVRSDGRFLAGVADRLTTTARHTVDRPDDIALLLASRRTAAPRDD
ncbi:SpoIIE family protein phosphatase [Streptomyces sp. NPDC048751]|uniref:SpoIIE family protein phosphatase n=1 Tax=Streptomyces sp. NPDC048751 TaxID=3365591 RepID=UPI0037153D2C